MTKYYVSSKLKHAQMWRDSGLDIVSSWLHTDEPLSDPVELGQMWNRYSAEIEYETDVFVLYLEPGEVPKGALVELGMALTVPMPVYIIWSGTMLELEAIAGTIIYHGNVAVIPSLKDLPRD